MAITNTSTVVTWTAVDVDRIKEAEEQIDARLKSRDYIIRNTEAPGNASNEAVSLRFNIALTTSERTALIAKYTAAGWFRGAITQDSESYILKLFRAAS